MSGRGKEAVMSRAGPGQFWVRLKFTGGGAPPSRDFVGETLLLQSCWINASDVYSFIALPNKRDFEICFFREAPLRRFLEIQASNSTDPKWRDWTLESSIQIDTTNIVVKFWTGRIADEDIELYLRRYCSIIHQSKPVDKFGIWYGVRRYKVKINKDSNGHYVTIPNSISLGPYNGRIIYPGQIASCFICQSPDHQVRQCPLVKCWRCGDYGHRAKDCEAEALCSLCGEHGHTYFTCPKSHYNKLKSQPTSAQASNAQPNKSYAQALSGPSLNPSQFPDLQPSARDPPRPTAAPPAPPRTNKRDAMNQDKSHPVPATKADPVRAAAVHLPPETSASAEEDPPDDGARPEQPQPVINERPPPSSAQPGPFKPPPGANERPGHAKTQTENSSRTSDQPRSTKEQICDQHVTDQSRDHPPNSTTPCGLLYRHRTTPPRARLKVRVKVNNVMQAPARPRAPSRAPRSLPPFAPGPPEPLLLLQHL
ncbi:hypothetical protein WMY93_000012 [Mugilogobius chulae]|uniref:CCHC-type domain-containing protein n=1 Tax=Mugilogobius chulae TaxID=88201 RepID=A0AAW0QD30_9GOBI